MLEVKGWRSIWVYDSVNLLIFESMLNNRAKTCFIDLNFFHLQNTQNLSSMLMPKVCRQEEPRWKDNRHTNWVCKGNTLSAGHLQNTEWERLAPHLEHGSAGGDNGVWRVSLGSYRKVLPLPAMQHNSSTKSQFMGHEISPFPAYSAQCKEGLQVQQVGCRRLNSTAAFCGAIRLTHFWKIILFLSIPSLWFQQVKTCLT